MCNKIHGLFTTETVLLIFRPVVYENTILNCIFKEEDLKEQGHKLRGAVPSRVALSSSKCGPPDAILRVENPHGRKLKVNFTVCLHKAFINNYGNVAEFVEWIELNRLFGAQRFIIFNYTGNSTLHPYLDYYRANGMIALHQWPIKKFHHQIPLYGAQGALINDCIYKSMFVSKNLMLLDVDEIMVPHQQKTWEETLQKQETCHGATDYLVRNSFFYKTYKIDDEYERNNTLKSYNIQSLAITLRMNYTFPCPIRSKIIMRPDAVRYAGVHYAHQLKGGEQAQRCCIPPNQMLMHHYRYWLKNANDSLPPGKNFRQGWEPGWDEDVVDRTMWKFADQLVSRVQKVYREVGKT